MTLNHVSIFRKVKVIPDTCVSFLSITYLSWVNVVNLWNDFISACLIPKHDIFLQDVLFTSLFYNIFWWQFLQNISDYFFFVIIQLVKLEWEHRLWKAGMKRITVFYMRIETVFAWIFSAEISWGSLHYAV